MEGFKKIKILAKWLNDNGHKIQKSYETIVLKQTIKIMRKKEIVVNQIIIVADNDATQ